MGKPKKDHPPGSKFGRLTVVEEIEPVDKVVHGYTRRRFLFECECGTRIKAVWGKSDSCGCLQREAVISMNRTKRKAFGLNAFGILFCNYRKRAERHQLRFSITRNEMRQLVESPCHYCGRPPGQVILNRRGFGSFVYNGLDRMNSSEGYVSSNVVPCCKTCNYAKRNMSVDEFLAWVKQVALHNALIALW